MTGGSSLFMPIVRSETVGPAVRFRQSTEVRLLSGGPGGFRSETNRWKAGSIREVSIGFRAEIIRA